MARTNYLRAVTILTAVTIAAIVAMLVAYGSASAQSAQGGGCPGGGVGIPCAPNVVSTKPADGATNVDRDANIKAEFSKKMDESTINDENVDLREPPPPDCPQPCSPNIETGFQISYKAKKSQVKLNPFGQLAPNTLYEVTIEGGTGDDGDRAVKDKWGNEMSEDFTWTFTTGAE